MPILSPQAAKEATVWNAKVEGKLWRQTELPSPLSIVHIFPADDEPFAFLVATFQLHLGLLVDGKLGTDTLGALRAYEPGASPPEPGDEDDEEGLSAPTEPPMVEAPPARLSVSNALRIGGASVFLPKEMLDAGITASNFVDDDEHHFPYAYKRRHKVTYLVHHESVSMSAKATIRTLEAKRVRSAKQGKNGGKGYPYGIHLIGHPDGHLSCHADLEDDSLTHANYLNGHCVGIEWVNPYNPKWAKPPFTESIPAEWWTWVPKGGRALYTLPTRQQLVAATLLSRFLPEVLRDLPFRFPTRDLGPKQPRIQGWKDKRLPAPGILAHRDFSTHADGRYILEHVIAASA